jgi:hypothetical protein
MYLGRHQQAQEYIKNLLSNSTRPSKKYRQIWQKYLIQAYLKNNHNALALKTMQQYQKNYRDKSADFYALQQNVFYQTKQYEKINIKNSNNSNLQILSVLSKIQTQQNLNEIESNIKNKLNNKNLSKPEKYQYYLILSLLSQKQNKQRQKLVASIQAALLYPTINKKNSHILPFVADDLWQAYYDNGESILKKNNIKALQKRQIYQLSLKLKKTNPTDSLSLIVFRWANEKNTETQKKIATDFFTICKRTENCPSLLQFLFLKSSFFKPQTIPQQIKYDLIEQLIQVNKMQQAADIMEHTKNVPTDKNRYLWEITKAKILIQAGKTIPAITAIHSILDKPVIYTNKQIDQISQLIFDLQLLKQHTQAISLFNKIKQRKITQQRIREILFWQAESYDGLKQYEQSAYHYLKSAYHLNKSGADPWGQTARFNAAESLTKAGMLQDANIIYKKLLLITRNKQRYLIVKNRIEKNKKQPAEVKN